MIDELRTNRLLIRALRPSDVGYLIELDGDADVMRYITGGASPASVVEAELVISVG